MLELDTELSIKKDENGNNTVLLNGVDIAGLITEYSINKKADDVPILTLVIPLAKVKMDA